MTTNTNAAIAEDLQDTVSKALRRAWQLGQTYWQQADSEYTSQHRKADETQGKFYALVEETRTALSTAAQPPADGALNTIAALRAQLAEAGREIERLRDLCDDLYSDLLAAGSLAPRDCGAYALIQETIKLRRDRWARRQIPNADWSISPLSAPVAHKERESND